MPTALDHGYRSPAALPFGRRREKLFVTRSSFTFSLPPWPPSAFVARRRSWHVPRQSGVALACSSSRRVTAFFWCRRRRDFFKRGGGAGHLLPSRRATS